MAHPLTPRPDLNNGAGLGRPGAGPELPGSGTVERRSSVLSISRLRSRGGLCRSGNLSSLLAKSGAIFCGWDWDQGELMHALLTAGSKIAFAREMVGGWPCAAGVDGSSQGLVDLT